MGTGELAQRDSMAHPPRSPRRGRSERDCFVTTVGGFSCIPDACFEFSGGASLLSW